jgi:hypothetical protein
MKVAAISCLKDSKGHLSYMLEQTRAKAKEVRQAAFDALARFTDKDVIDSFIKAISGGDVDLVAGPVSENRSPTLLKFLLKEVQEQLDALLTLKDKAKLKKALTRFYQLLGGFVSRDDKKSGEFLVHCFNEREAIGRLKGTAVDGEAINVRVATLMVLSNSRTAQKALVDAHETLPPNCLGWAMIAAMRTRTPKQVYHLFSPYYSAVVPKKRGHNIVKEKQEVVRETLCEVAGGQMYRLNYGDSDLDDTEFAAVAGDVKIDPAWLDAAVAVADLPTVCCLARPKHKGTNRFLAKILDERLGKRGFVRYETGEALKTMIRIEHPQRVDYFLKALEKEGKPKSGHQYSAWWLLQLIPELPKSAAPKIEALLPKLSDKNVDEVIPYLEELKTK